MEKPKPTQSLEQKQETPEDYVVATFPVDTDPDNARRPLTVIRSGQDEKGVRHDGGWIVVLAIAMMDGSFDVDRQDKTVTHYRGDKERSGMHRDSARALLEYVRNNY